MNLSHDPSLVPSSDDTMTLWDLGQMLCANWRLIVASLAVSLIAAAGYLKLTPSQYETSLQIKVGRIGDGGSAKQIEAVGDVVERLHLPAFRKTVLKSLGWHGDLREHLYTSTFRATAPQDGYVAVSFRSVTPDDARRAADATFATLASIHKGLIETVVDKYKLQLAAIEAEIADTTAQLNRLEKLGNEIPQSDHQATLMWLQVTQNQKDRLNNQRHQETEIKEVLRPESIVPTSMLDGAAVPNRPVYPKPRQVWLLAGMGGFLLGILFITLRLLISTKKISPPLA